MNEFKGNSKDGFGVLGFISHLFISLSVLFVIFSMAAYFFTGQHETFGTYLAYGGVGIISGVGIGFINMFLN